MASGGSVTEWLGEYGIKSTEVEAAGSGLRGFDVVRRYSRTKTMRWLILRFSILGVESGLALVWA